MPPKYKRSTLQASKAKQKNTYHCSPCGNSYDSEKKFYEHCCGLLHQVKRKETEKDFKPRCFLCKSTFSSLDAYGDHLHKDPHKDAHKNFKQAIDEGSTIEQLVKSKVILSPNPMKSLMEGIKPPKKPLKQALGGRPKAKDNSHMPDNETYWNFDHSQPPANYENGNFYGDPQQRYPGEQYLFYRPLHNWQNQQSNHYPQRGPYSNGSNHNWPHHHQQNAQARYYNAPSWPYWKNPNYRSQRNDYFNNEPFENFQPNHGIREENSQLNHRDIRSVQRQHIYYADDGNTTKNSELATGDSKKITKNEGKPVEDKGKPVKDSENVTERANRHAVSRNSNSPKILDNENVFASRDTNPSTWKLGSINHQQARSKAVPVSFTFALPESLQADSSISDSHASTKARTESLADANKKRSQSPKASFTPPKASCSRQSPKTMGITRSSKGNLKMNVENLRNLVNLSCSRKEKFILERLMHEYDQMTFKAAMNRMGQNLVTMVDKDAAKDVMDSLSACGLVDSGGSENEHPSRGFPEHLMGQIEEMLHGSYQHGHPMAVYSEESPHPNLDMNKNTDFEADREAGMAFEKPQMDQGYSPENFKFAFHNDEDNNDHLKPRDSFQAVQKPPKKNTRWKKKPRGGLLPEPELTVPVNDIAQKDEAVETLLIPVAPFKKKSKSTSDSIPSSIQGIDPLECSQEDLLGSLPELSTAENSSLVDLQPNQVPNVIKKKPDEGSSEMLPNDSPKAAAKSKKSKACKSKKEFASAKNENGSKKSTKTPKKKKVSDKTPAEEPGPNPETSMLEETMLDASLQPGNVSTSCETSCDVAATIKRDVEDRSNVVDLPDIIEEPHIKQEKIQADVIDLGGPEYSVPPEGSLPPPSRTPTPATLETSVPVPNPHVDNSSNVTVKALNFAIEEENIQCKIQHIERQLTTMKTAFERQIADITAAYEREVEEARSEQEKLKERGAFVRYKCDSLMKRLLKSQDGRAIAASLKRIFSEMPNDLKSTEDENPKSHGDEQPIQDAVALRDVSQSEPMQTEVEVQDNVHVEISISTKLKKQEKLKRKREDKPDKNSKKKKTKKAKQSSKTEETSAEIKQEELPLMPAVSKDWATAKSKQVSRFDGHVDQVVALKIHKNRLYSCSNDGTIRQFKTKRKDNESKMKCTAILTHGSDAVVGMEIVNQVNEIFIFTASRCGTLKKFDSSTGNCMATLETNNEIVCTISRWGSLFVACCDGNISRHSLMHLRELDSFPWSNMSISCMTSATEGAYRMLCIGSEDGLINLKEAHSGLFIRSYTLEEGEYPFRIEVLNDVSYTLGSKNNQCRSISLHKILNGDFLQRINICADVSCMKIFAPNLILLSGKLGVIRVCDPEKQTQRLYYGGGFNTISSLCMHRNMIISGSKDGKIEGCDMASDQTFVCNYGKCPGIFAFQNDLVYHVSKMHGKYSQTQCLGNSCDYIFQDDPSERIQHILTHVQFKQEK